MSNKNTNRGADCGWEERPTLPSIREELDRISKRHEELEADIKPLRDKLRRPGPIPGTEYVGVDYGKARTFEGDLDAVLGRVKELLMAKNAAYGDAALNPLRFHSSASPVEQLNVRMDDKLSRMARGGKSDEDEPLDYVGYWVLREIAKLREAGINE